MPQWAVAIIVLLVILLLVALISVPILLLQYFVDD